MPGASPVSDESWPLAVGVALGEGALATGDDVGGLASLGGAAVVAGGDVAAEDHGGGEGTGVTPGFR